MRANTRVLSGFALLALVGLPASRALLEPSMFLHMLVQLPALVVAGCLLADALPDVARRMLQSFNASGLAGWTLASLALAFWMLPRALDAAVAEPGVASAKFAALLLAGLAARLSWAASGAVVQLFFLGNWAWMTATVGLLYVEAPVRLCNAYLVSDQVLTGYGLVAQAVLVPVLWGYTRAARSAAVPAGEAGEG